MAKNLPLPTYGDWRDGLSREVLGEGAEQAHKYPIPVGGDTVTNLTDYRIGFMYGWAVRHMRDAEPTELGAVVRLYLNGDDDDRSTPQERAAWCTYIRLDDSARPWLKAGQAGSWDSWADILDLLTRAGGRWERLDK